MPSAFSAPYIFHITTEAEWILAQLEGAYHGSTRGLTLVEVGFIHCALQEQVHRVANSFFRGVPHLVLLRIATDRLKAQLRFEGRQGGNELFPHVYGPLNLDAVVAVAPLRAGADGNFGLPLAASS
jgi:glutathione S-transferase